MDCFDPLLFQTNLAMRMGTRYPLSATWRRLSHVTVKPSASGIPPLTDGWKCSNRSCLCGCPALNCTTVSTQSPQSLFACMCFLTVFMLAIC